jgi:DNA-binding response OmpR family regulator
MRAKIEVARGQPELIKTVRNRGYYFTAAPEVIA